VGTAYRRLTRIEGQVSQARPEMAKTHDVLIDAKVTKLVKNSDMWIEVFLDEQMLYMYKATDIIKAYLVSSGKPGDATHKSKATRKGVYKMYSLYKSYPMWGRDEKGGWWCPDVPYTMFFHGEFAIHAAYWHNNFGTPVSHGCVNMTEMDAKEVYEQVKKGTVVWVH